MEHHQIDKRLWSLAKRPYHVPRKVPKNTELHHVVFKYGYKIHLQYA